MSDDAKPSIVTPALTPEQAQLVLRRNVQNLAKKVNAGKLLSNSEQALVEAMAGGHTAASPAAKAHVSNQVELAEALGVTRKSVQRWIKEGAPAAAADGRWSVVAWRAWMKANSKKGGAGDAAEDAGPTKTQLEAKRLLLANEKLEFEIAVLKEQYTENEEVEKQFAALCTEVKKVLLAMPDALAPQVVGLTVPEAAKRLRDAVDDALMRLHTGSGGGGP